MSTQDKRLLLLHEQDNVLVCCQNIPAGSELLIEGKPVVLSTAVELGHKLARRDIAVAEKIARYGLPIGSATQAIRCGQQVHTHNMKSDYLASHHRDAVEGHT
ncbi:Altronate dehydratase [Halioglobus japonicus]|nr:Altronate dehydratase [Halioglobus japonicus]